MNLINSSDIIISEIFFMKGYSMIIVKKQKEFNLLFNDILGDTIEAR